MKCFPISTILGLTLGILLAFGVAVSAFQSPTQPPPAGNVPSPLNTGSSDQTKTGGLLNVFGLWVNQSLGVTGGATLGGILNLQQNRIINVGLPSVAGDVATRGFVDSATSNLQTRVSGSCPGGQGIRAVGSDGSVTCEILPVGLRSGDIGAIGWAAYSTTSPVCSSPPSGNLCGCEGSNNRAGCNWWAGTHRGPADLRAETDPRNILSVSNSYSSCYTGWGTYPNCATTPLDYTASFQCSSPWSVSQDALTNDIASACGWAWQSFPYGCIAAYCRYP